MSGLVRRLCNQGRLKEAIHILYAMDQRVTQPDFSMYVSLLQECLDKKALQEGKLVHAHMIHSGFNPDTYLGTKFVIMYAKCSSLADARQFLDRMPQRNVVSWTALIAAYTKHGLYEEALTLFYQMQRTGVQPDQFAFASVLPACAQLGALEHGRKLHEDIINRGFQSNIFVGNALVDMYAKCGREVDARQVFDKMSERDIVSWNAMIAGYAQNGYVDEAMKLFQRMGKRDVISWNVMIAGYAQNGHVHETLKLFQKMEKRNVVSWTALIACYARNERVDEGLKLFQKMPERNVVSWTAVISGYAECARVDQGLKLFQKMPQRDVVSWSAMIAGYAQNGCFSEGLKCFGQMRLTGVKPVSVTFASVLPACANLAALKYGKGVHQSILKSRFQSDVSVGSALVDLYSKCGVVEDARQVFDEMPERNVVSWTSMIVGYAMHGYARKALQLFEQMQESGTEPNHITFVGVLSACCHAGLVDEGWKHFYEMSRHYCITPTLEHYCCMVDILGRAGHLDEAEDFINRMPVKPNAAVWGSMLAACRIHTNIDLGERVAKCLFKLEPKNSANYVLLSNIYTAAGRWHDVEKVQKMMKDRKIKGIPGCSWIEANDKVYSFHVRDKSHPQMHQIYTELERLYGDMKVAGYVPCTNLVMNNDVEA